MAARAELRPDGESRPARGSASGPCNGGWARVHARILLQSTASFPQAQHGPATQLGQRGLLRYPYVCTRRRYRAAARLAAGYADEVVRVHPGTYDRAVQNHPSAAVSAFPDERAVSTGTRNCSRYMSLRGRRRRKGYVLLSPGSRLDSGSAITVSPCFVNEYTGMCATGSKM